MDNNGLAGRMREETNFPVFNTPCRNAADFESKGDIPTATSSPALKALFFNDPSLRALVTIRYLHANRLIVCTVCLLFEFQSNLAKRLPSQTLCISFSTNPDTWQGLPSAHTRQILFNLLSNGGKEFAVS